MYARQRAVKALVLAPLLLIGCQATAEDDAAIDESNLTEHDAALAGIREAVHDVDQEHVTFAPSVRAPRESAASGAKAGKTSLYGVDWYQKWAGGRASDHDWAIGSEFGKRCMWASVARFEAIMAAPPSELTTFLGEYGKWDGSFYNWNDDFGGSSAEGKAAFGDAKGARLWAWRSSLVKWVSATAKDGSCYLPTRTMLMDFVTTCKAHAADNNGEMQGCEIRSSPAP